LRVKQRRAILFVGPAPSRWCLRAALQYPERLSRLVPDDRGLASLVDEIRRDTANVSR